MLAYSLYLFFSGFALFLLGFSVFMYFEARKFGDNQFTMKLLPPPPKLERPSVSIGLALAAAPQFKASNPESLVSALEPALSQVA